MRRRLAPALLGSLAFVTAIGAGCRPRASATPAGEPASAAAAAPPAAADDVEARFAAGEWRAAADAYQARWAAGKPLTIQSRVKAAIACHNLGDDDAAFIWLERAFAAGAPAKILAQLPSLAPLAADPRWQALSERHAEACAEPIHHALDFWIGEWEVEDPSGNRVGHNRIQRELRGCLLTESWTAATGAQGRSINFYDPAIGRWRQHWVDEGGRTIAYVGAPEGGAMVLEGDLALRDGTVLRSRMTLSPETGPTVRQRIESSHDDGASWELWFEGIYRPVGTRSPADRAEGAATPTPTPGGGG